MRGDIPAVALRLASTLGARTHEQRRVAPMSKQLRHYHENKRRANQVGGGDHSRRPRRVTIDGTVYANKKAALIALKIGSGTFYEWIATGRAKRG